MVKQLVFLMVVLLILFLLFYACTAPYGILAPVLLLVIWFNSPELRLITIQLIILELVIVAANTIQIIPITVPALSVTEGAEPTVIWIGNKVIMMDSITTLVAARN